jgi:transposase
VSRLDLADEEWAIIKPLLPKHGCGPKRKDDRKVLNGIFYILRTDALWLLFRQKAMLINQIRTIKNLYAMRNIVERFFCKMKEMRRLATLKRIDRPAPAFWARRLYWPKPIPSFDRRIALNWQRIIAGIKDLEMAAKTYSAMPKTRSMAGPRMTRNSTGRKNRIIGTVSFGGRAAAFFSASCIRNSRFSAAITRSEAPSGVP